MARIKRLEEIFRNYLVQPFAQSRLDVPGRSGWSKPSLRKELQKLAAGGKSSAVSEGCQPSPCAENQVWFTSSPPHPLLEVTQLGALVFPVRKSSRCLFSK